LTRRGDDVSTDPLRIEDTDMGLMDDIAGKAESALDTDGLAATATGAVDSLTGKAKEAVASVPGGDKLEGLIDKAKGLLDKDGDGEIDLIEKAKGFLHKD
jgi:uncharacterized protein YjbJ (UPF0337 family)